MEKKIVNQVAENSHKMAGTEKRITLVIIGMVKGLPSTAKRIM